MAARAMGHTYTPPTDDAPGSVVLEIQHLDTDSYSRSVDRAAMSWANRVGVRNYPRPDWSLTDAQYGAREGSQSPNGRPWCVSVFTFTLTRRAS